MTRAELRSLAKMALKIFFKDIEGETHNPIHLIEIGFFLGRDAAAVALKGYFEDRYTDEEIEVIQKKIKALGK